MENKKYVNGVRIVNNTERLQVENSIEYVNRLNNIYDQYKFLSKCLINNSCDENTNEYSNIKNGKIEIANRLHKEFENTIKDIETFIKEL